MGSLLWVILAWMGFSVLVAALPAAIESTYRGLPPRVRRGAWFLLALRAAIPMGLVPLTLGTGSPAPAPLPVPETVSAVPLVVPSVGSAAAPGDPTAWVLALVYLVGLGVVWTRAWSGRAAWRRVLGSSQVPTARARGIVEEERTRLRLGAAPRVVVVPGVPSPCLVGLFRPLLVLPEESRFTDAELAWMVRHELEHHKAGDLGMTAVVRGLQLVFWFLPGMWWISQRFLSALEEACDHRVLARCGEGERRSYAQTLVKFLETTSPPSVVAMASPVGRLRHRFRLIANPPRPSVPAMVLLAAVVVVSGGWGVAGTAPVVDTPLVPGWPFAAGTPCWVTSPYGEAENPITKKPYFHQGIDLATRARTPVYSPWAGVVTQAGFDTAQGFFLNVDLGGGWSLRASHLAILPPVSAGDRVEAGQVMGLVGSTGLSTGPHLHLEIAKNGVAVDPAPYLLAP